MNTRSFSRWPGSVVLTIALALAILALAWRQDQSGAGIIGAEFPAAALAQAQGAPLVLLGLPVVMVHRVWQRARD